MNISVVIAAVLLGLLGLVGLFGPVIAGTYLAVQLSRRDRRGGPAG